MKVAICKKDKAKFDEKLAPKAFLPLLTAAAKKHVRELARPRRQVEPHFSPISRRHAALALVQDFDAWYATDYQLVKKK